MNGKTIEESKALYEQSAVRQLMEKSGHEVCTRCYCCDVVPESAPCWSCGGFQDVDDEWDDGYCEVCGGEGEIYFKECIGRCDENGHHARVGADEIEANHGPDSPTKEKC